MLVLFQCLKFNILLLQVEVLVVLVEVVEVEQEVIKQQQGFLLQLVFQSLWQLELVVRLPLQQTALILFFLLLPLLAVDMAVPFLVVFHQMAKAVDQVVVVLELMLILITTVEQLLHLVRVMLVVVASSIPHWEEMQAAVAVRPQQELTELLQTQETVGQESLLALLVWLWLELVVVVVVLVLMPHLLEVVDQVVVELVLGLLILLLMEPQTLAAEAAVVVTLEADQVVLE